MPLCPSAGPPLANPVAHAQIRHYRPIPPDFHAAVFLLPSLERLFRYSELADQLGNRYAQFRPRQNGLKLLNSDSLLLHGTTLPLQI
jgi:hypothetical protein